MSRYHDTRGSSLTLSSRSHFISSHSREVRWARIFLHRQKQRLDRTSNQFTNLIQMCKTFQGNKMCTPTNGVKGIISHSADYCIYHWQQRRTPNRQPLRKQYPTQAHPSKANQARLQRKHKANQSRTHHVFKASLPP